MFDLADTASCRRWGRTQVGERLGQRTCCGWGIEADTGATGLLHLDLLLLLLLLLSEQLGLELGGLLGLNLLLDAHDFELHHLHLQSVVVVLTLILIVRLGIVVGESSAVGVHDPGLLLLLHKAIVRAVDGGGHGKTSVGKDLLAVVDLEELVVLLFWIILLVRVGGSTVDVERSSGSSSVGDGVGGRADAACSETSEERGTRVVVLGGHGGRLGRC